MTNHEGVSGSMITSAITAIFALLPDSFLSYGGKLMSVLVLAAAAEIGRRLVTLLWKDKKR